MAERRRQRRRSIVPSLVLIVVLAVLIGGSVLAYRTLKGFNLGPSTPHNVADGCLFTSNEQSTFLGTTPAKWASVIVAESVRRGLPPRAATIAIATAMQESGLRNLDHGDRDSLGLFQQRPSQDWGTPEQIMDPWYSSGKFYEALVKVEGWQRGDINDVAQAVQRSGVPDGYRKHVEKAKIIASALTGHSAEGISCASSFTQKTEDPMANQILQHLDPKVSARRTGRMLTLRSTDGTTLQAATNMMMANLNDLELVSVQTPTRSWTHSREQYAPWQQRVASASPSAPAGAAPSVVLTSR